MDERAPALPPAAEAAAEANDNDNRENNQMIEWETSSDSTGSDDEYDDDDDMMDVCDMKHMPPNFARSLEQLLQPEDLTMLLYNHEMDRAQQIKNAVAKRKDLKPLTDYACVQYAICTANETMDQILERITMMQAFKDEYKIDDTVAQGMQLMDELSRDVLPGFLISMDYIPKTHNYLCVTNLGSLLPSRCESYETFRVFVGAMYYKHQALMPHFCSVREGSSHLVECLDAASQNCEIWFFEKFMHELWRYYPVHPKELLFLNSPGCVNVVMAFWQKWMKPEMRQSVRLGYQIAGMEGQSIRALYETPTAETARQVMLRKIEGYLQQRYHNEATFQLGKRES